MKSDDDWGSGIESESGADDWGSADSDNEDHVGGAITMDWHNPDDLQHRFNNTSGTSVCDDVWGSVVGLHQLDLPFIETGPDLLAFASTCRHFYQFCLRAWEEVFQEARRYHVGAPPQFFEDPRVRGLLFANKPYLGKLMGKTLTGSGWSYETKYRGMPCNIM
jgi:hypothetical protein